MPPSKIGLFRILNIDRKKFYLTDTKENKEKPLFFLMSDHMNANGWWQIRWAKKSGEKY